MVGSETLAVAGTPVETSVVSVSRRSRPGSEVVTQRMTLWFDPVRRLSVKVEDTIHADRVNGLLTLTYDAQYTATLVA